MMRSAIKYSAILLLLCLGFVQYGNAQVTEVDVYTGFEPKVADVDKINAQPVIADTFQVNQKFDYQVNPVEVDAKYTPDTISAARMKSEPLAKLHRFYLKAGFGNYLTPYVDFHINSLRHKSDSYVFRYKHLSSQGNIKYNGFPGVSDNEFFANYSHMFKTSTITLDGEYHRNVVHYYNYDPAIDTLVSRDSTRQRFSRINFSANFYSNNRTDSVKLNHKTTLDFYHMTDLYRTMENYVGVRTELNKFTNLFAKEFFGGSFTFQYYNNKNDSTGTTNAVFMNISPYMKLGGKKWMLKVGLDLVLGVDDSTRFHVYPNINFNWNIYRNYIQFYTDVTGKLERQSFLRLTQQNAFLMSTAPLANMNEMVKVKAGLRGSFTDNLSYNAGASVSLTKNLPFFVNDTMDFQRRGFTVLYDQTTIVTVFGELSYVIGEKLLVSAKANYNSYTPSTLTENWHKPFIDGTISARYNFRDKLIFTADLYFIGPQMARTFALDTATNTMVPRATRLDGMIDLNVGAEYRLTKMLSFWVNFNNFAAWRYNRWYGYPTQQFNIIGGLTFGI